MVDDDEDEATSDDDRHEHELPAKAACVQVGVLRLAPRAPCQHLPPSLALACLAPRVPGLPSLAQVPVHNLAYRHVDLIPPAAKTTTS